MVADIFNFSTLEAKAGTFLDMFQVSLVYTVSSRLARDTNRQTDRQTRLQLGTSSLGVGWPWGSFVAPLTLTSSRLISVAGKGLETGETGHRGSSVLKGTGSGMEGLCRMEMFGALWECLWRPEEAQSLEAFKTGFLAALAIRVKEMVCSAAG